MGSLRKPRRRAGAEISIRWWDALVSRWFRDRIRDIRPGDSRPWRHPWSCDLSWDAVEKEWRVEIEPGDCLSPTGTIVVTARVPDEEGEPGDLPLSDRPPISLPADRWRVLGTEAVGVGDAPGEAAPLYFQRLGVAAPTTLIETGSGLAEQISGDISERNQARLLRAVDLVIRHARRRVVYGATLDAAAQTVAYAPTLLPAATEGGATLEVQTRYTPASEQGVIGGLTGSIVDPGYDETLIATLYLMSPPGMPPGSPLDETWSPEVRHARFWHLDYVTKYREPEAASPPIAFPVTGLGLGTLEQNVRPILDAINANNALAEAILARASAVGRFYSMC